MIPDLQRMPAAVELFAQWRTARGAREEAATRPFTRSWPDLLEAAGLNSAVEQREAEQDVRNLAQAELLELKFVRYKQHLIDRVAIPLAAEPRWREAFGFVPPNDQERRKIQEHPWHPRLAFVRETVPAIPFEELMRLDAFLRARSGSETVPIKERSLEVFGDEKRLDMLEGGTLFAPGRLTLDDLGCFIVSEPLSWKRGMNPGGPVMVLENLATWHSYVRWDSERHLFSAIVYGGGKRFIDSVLSMPDLFAELGSAREVFYFGDLDPAGLRIPRVASERAGAGSIQPHGWSYRELLRIGRAYENRGEIEVNAADLEWLGGLGAEAAALFATGRRMPQELLGWEHLRGKVPL